MVIKFSPQKDLSMHGLFPAASNYHVVSRITFELYAVLAAARLYSNMKHCDPLRKLKNHAFTICILRTSMHESIHSINLQFKHLQ